MASSKLVKELGISFNYVKNWGLVEAVRELVQNITDAESIDSENKALFHYDEDLGILYLGNAKSVLDKSTLFLGETSKSSDDRQVGKHGEGYKVAGMVLTRLGKEVSIITNSEQWLFGKMTTGKYGEKLSIPVVRFNSDLDSHLSAVIEMDAFWVEDCEDLLEPSLMYRIKGISRDDMNLLCLYNLPLQKRFSSHESDFEVTDKGTIYKEGINVGKFFVNGLFVQETNLLLGYDVVSSMVSLDRDRSLLRDFDLELSASKLLLLSEDMKLISELINKDCLDAKYMHYYWWELQNKRRLREKAKEVESEKESKVEDLVAKEFYEKHGEDAIPCTTFDEVNEGAKSGKNAVLVSGNKEFVIRNSSIYSEKEKLIVKEPTLTEKVSDWIERVSEFLSDELREEGAELLEKLRLRIGD